MVVSQKDWELSSSRIAKRAKSKNRVQILEPHEPVQTSWACSERNRGSVDKIFVSKTWFWNTEGLRV